MIMKKNTLLGLLGVAALTGLTPMATFAQKTPNQKGAMVFGKAVHASSVNPKTGHIRCATTEYEEYLRAQNPKRATTAQFEAWLAPLVEQAKNNKSEAGGVITIPVVVHVIHNGQALGAAPNITDAQVMSQITVLNNDYRRLAGTPGFNTNPVGADTMIQFALAKQDPNGNPTNGIDRVNLCQSSWSTTEIDNYVKPNTIWNPTQYLNMWSVNFTDDTLLGYAQFPSNSTLGGLSPDEGPANTDGVVSNFSTFGSSDYTDGTFMLAAPYDKGRTMTHEVGHWLGLRHIWGDNSSCTVNIADSFNDYCPDTPAASEENYECPTGTDSCPSSPGLDMIQNYMDYTDDTCMNIFTANQKTRIATVMNNALRRVELKTSTKDQPIALFANDAEIKIDTDCTAVLGAACGAGGQAVKKVIVYNRGTSTLTSVGLNYNVNGGANTPYTWTGSLASNAYAVISLPVAATASGTFNVAVTTANGVADQRATNNTASGTIAASLPANFETNQVVFRLQRDRYGAETTWNLKNSAGTILYQGSGYSNTSPSMPALLTQNWTLASNDCYTFTILDAEGDGICCDYGSGFYDIKTPTGTVIVSGGQFGDSESKAFRINALGTTEFNVLGAITVYPNPTKDILNIMIPQGLDLPESYVVYNSLGQTIVAKNKVTTADLSVNTADLSNGVYFIKINKDGNTKTIKFVKN